MTENLSLSKLILVINKNKTYYLILDKVTKKKIRINMMNVRIPFGYEKYGDGYILNLEIDPKDDVHNTYYKCIGEFESELKGKAIDDKEYIGNMRESKEGYIVRTHIRGYPEIYSMFGDYKNLMTSRDLKHSFANVVLELEQIWTTDDKYGLLWGVKEIEIISSY